MTFSQLFLIGNELRRSMNVRYHLNLSVNVLRAISIEVHNIKKASIFDIPRDSQMKKGDMEEQEPYKLD